ncbi:putative DNA-binding domain-containing protein [Simiduia sp. 21SJ11W-1]|uniref:HvfC family RiPP maturation protein n=1 Tax=Simiduia sp. 21SJ11W-1 TaxID=2909669 RepID=UPI0020A0430E|nr:putative DNA-binding domain-containing protein [Simiduia sp. 21SJ11W-1]UTA48983.1 putative DNA-binding domain-containing protein [Simiduia sp. 21SJ11W-1]
MSETRARQFELTRHLRDPDRAPAPAGVEPRRLKVYQELVYNNIEGFLSSGFPIFRSLISDARWGELVRGFVRDYRAQSPYFLEIGQEFYHYVSSAQCSPLPPFTQELMHYEWVELALDVAPDELPPPVDGPVSDAHILNRSPLAWPLAYQWPVHMIGEQHQPEHPPEAPSFFVVYRNRQDEVRFMALNGMSYALLAQFDQQPNAGFPTLVEAFSAQLPEPPGAQFTEQLRATVQQFVDLDVLLICE